MQAYVGITDYDWFRLLEAQADLDEVNFWQPGGNRIFKALEPGGLFLFKLHAPRRSIVGGGLFAHATLLEVSLAWESFGLKNGARSLAEMRARIERYRKRPASPREDYRIGCILLEQPFFLPEGDWIPEPPDWHPNIVQGKGYDLRSDHGREIWHRLRDALGMQSTTAAWPAAWREPDTPRYGDPLAVRPRLGQGSFRVLVTEAYERRCAITGERVLPVLEAAHIQPYASGGEHRVENGLLLRSDLHTLFDRGYVTVTPDLRFEVSGSIREDFHNGRSYYGMHGHDVRAPAHDWPRPDRELLRWHNDAVFRG